MTQKPSVHTARFRRTAARRLRHLLTVLIWLALVAGMAFAIVGIARALRPAEPEAPSAPEVAAAPVRAPEAAAVPDPMPEVPDYVVQDLLPRNEFSRPGTALETVNAVVVHYTGNPGTTAEQNRSYFAGLAETGETYASSHFIIGIDGTVIQCVPLDEIAYCSNERNRDSISIECCHAGEDGAFSDETRQSLVRLLRWLCQSFDLDRADILRHYDVTQKLCPLYYVNNPAQWEALKDEVFE